MRKDDPCISLCRFDGKTGWCLGCGRTVPEIRAWTKLTPFRRTALARQLPRRVDQLAAAAVADAREAAAGKRHAARDDPPIGADRPGDAQRQAGRRAAAGPR